MASLWGMEKTGLLSHSLLQYLRPSHPPPPSGDFLVGHFMFVQKLLDTQIAASYTFHGNRKTCPSIPFNFALYKNIADRYAFSPKRSNY